MSSGTGGPRAFWEREQGSALRSTLPTSGPSTTATPPGASAPPAVSGGSAPAARPGSPRTVGPPPRVGGAVAALVVAALTLVVPVLGVSLGLWFFLLVANLPGIGLGITTLVKVPNAPEVERFLRYTWACNLAYVTLSVVFLIPVMVIAALAFMLSA